MPQTDHARSRPPLPIVIACLLAVYVIWGTTYYAIKIAITGMATFFLVGTRFLAAGGVILLWQLLRGAPMPSRRQWAGAALIGALLLVAGNGSVSLAEHWMSSGATVALLSSVPLSTAAWSGAFGEWPRPLEWLAIAAGAAGVAVMLLGRDLQASPAGACIVLGGSVCWSLGTVLSRRIDLPSGATGFGAELLCAGVIGLAISALAGERWTAPPAGGVWMAWGYLIVFGSLVGFSAFRFIVERVSATLGTTYAYVNPPVALFTGWWLGHESFSAPLLLGLPVVLGAVALQTWAQMRGRPAAPAAPA